MTSESVLLSLTLVSLRRTAGVDMPFLPYDHLRRGRRRAAVVCKYFIYFNKQFFSQIIDGELDPRAGNSYYFNREACGKR